MKLRQDIPLAGCVTSSQSRSRLIIEAPSGLKPAPIDQPADFVCEEDLIEASSLPLSPTERLALVAVGLTPTGASDRRAYSAVGLPEGLAQAIAAEGMKPKYDLLNGVMMEPAKVAGFILDWLETGTRAESSIEQAQLFAKFVNATKIVLELSNVEFAAVLGVSRRTLHQWSRGNCTLSRNEQESVLRRLAARAGEVV